MNNKIEQLQKIKVEISTLEEIKNALEKEIIEEMEKLQLKKYEDSNFKVSYTPQKNEVKKVEKFDERKYSEENPLEYLDYVFEEEKVVTRKATIRVTPIKNNEEF